jgi:segregation and condensation protein B
VSEQDRVPQEELVAAVGAMIFASDEPVQPKELASALGGLTQDEVRGAIVELEQRLEQAAVGLQVERVAGGARLATRTDVGAWVRRLFRQRNRTRLSLPALETLAIVAYRQPVTAPEIQAIRGKDPSAALKGLLDKKLLRCLGRKKVVGNPLLYGTTKGFLEHFGLNDLTDLPSLEEFDQLIGVLEERQASLDPAPEGEDRGESESTDGTDDENAKGRPVAADEAEEPAREGA